MANIKADFYTVTTTGDGTATEVLLYDDVPGELEVSTQRVTDGELKGQLVTYYMFYPARWLFAVLRGQTVKVGTDVYAVEYFEEFKDHQEILLRKITA